MPVIKKNTFIYNKTKVHALIGQFCLCIAVLRVLHGQSS